jgi:hypothetical protein
MGGAPDNSAALQEQRRQRDEARRAQQLANEDTARATQQGDRGRVRSARRRGRALTQFDEQGKKKQLGA